ncbi:MAG TPA: choice-of-anchor A family protein [Methylovorus sp.]|jgi:choice-of-anchor A domain-containing protein|nr:choice-of-anchor A family protein [Methylovorus sp.]
MFTKTTSAVMGLALMTLTASANAAVDLGVAGKFNAFVFSTFNSQYSDTEGAVAVGGNTTVNGYSVNANNKPYNGYALVVGGNLNYTNGSINNGNAYVAGASSTSSVGGGATISSGTAPFSFADEKTELIALSSSLSQLGATGSTAYQYGGVTFTGNGSSGVQVFNVSGADLYSVNYSNFAQLSSNQTIIVNVSGAVAGFQGGTPNGFSNYNVLFNFYEATTLNFNNVGVYGSILAPFATVQGGGGQINGNVIVNAWNSNIQINANHYFTGADITIPVSAVPEPQSYMMLFAGLGLIGFMATRRRYYF